MSVSSQDAEINDADSQDSYIDSSDEENIDDIVELIICSECREELGSGEEFLEFLTGIKYCMECADVLEHTTEIYTDDEIEN